MQNMNLKVGTAPGLRSKTLVQVVESETCTILRELDATDLDPECVAEGAMRNLNPHRYFTRIVGPHVPSGQNA